MWQVVVVVWARTPVVAVVLASVILLKRRKQTVAVDKNIDLMAPTPNHDAQGHRQREFMHGLASQPALLRSFQTTRRHRKSLALVS